MPCYIASATVDILNLLRGTVTFAPGLNFISGENGTLKTRFLQMLRSGATLELVPPGVPPRTMAISPRRNAERRNINTILETIRSQNRTYDVVWAERLNASINDQTFDVYPAFGDLYYITLNQRVKEGLRPNREYAEALTAELQYPIRAIFPPYALEAEWDVTRGAPNIALRKHGTTKMELDWLSLGEQQILSLVTCLFTSRDNFDVYLIDEPEVHLNWNLEERLFRFLSEFCERFGKQVICVTHSRAIFLPQFFGLTQFLTWSDDGQVVCGRELTPAQRRNIAGEAISILALGGFTTPTFFVEDEMHVKVVNALAKAHGVDVVTSYCGNALNVRSLFRLSQKDRPAWRNCYFITDNDNQGSPFPEAREFIHLDKYCMENYLLDPAIVSTMLGTTEAEFRQRLCEMLKGRFKKLVASNRLGAFLLEQLKPEDVTPERMETVDVSEIFRDIVKESRWTVDDFIDEYIVRARAVGLAQTMPARVVAVMEELARARGAAAS